MCLAWLHCSTSESQWLQYFKLIFIEIQNVSLRTVFTNPITFTTIPPSMLHLHEMNQPEAIGTNLMVAVKHGSTSDDFR